MTPDELKAWRESLGLSQIKFGMSFLPDEYSPSTISAWETGRAPIPGWMSAVKQISDQNKLASES
jgi:DNA-binding transcriptional regulator YiaG